MTHIERVCAGAPYLVEVGSKLLLVEIAPFDDLRLAATARGGRRDCGIGGGGGRPADTAGVGSSRHAWGLCLICIGLTSEICGRQARRERVYMCLWKVSGLRMSRTVVLSVFERAFGSRLFGCMAF